MIFKFGSYFEKVVLDTSNLIRTKEEIFTIRKIACFMDKEEEVNMAINTPDKKNLLTRIFNEKNILREDMKKERSILKNNKCLLTKNSNMLALAESDVFFISSMASASFMFILASRLQLVKKGNKFRIFFTFLRN